MAALTFRLACCVGLLLVASAFAPKNLVTGDGGRMDVRPDLSKLNLVRVVYGSEGGRGEAYYDAMGRIWARWETDFPMGDENLGYRLSQLTRITVNPRVASRYLTAEDLGDFPLLYTSDPGWMSLSETEVQALRDYLNKGGFLWGDDFWGDAEWRQLESVMQRVLQGREWRVLDNAHHILVQPVIEQPLRLSITSLG